MCRRPPILALAIVSAIALSACDTAEERAEEHYERAMALLEEGDVDRAMVEFRNVFRLDGNHHEARAEYAGLLVEQGRLDEAFGQYLRLVEQDWQNVGGHRRLAELALSIEDFESARTHVDAAYDIDPSDPAVRGLKAAVDYREGDREPAVEMARGVLAEEPGNLAARTVLIADRIAEGDNAAALTLVEEALRLAPDDEGLALAKLQILERMGDAAGVGAELAKLAGRFPENAGIRDALVRWHVADGDLDAAEKLLREASAAAPAEAETQLRLVQFLGELRGPQAARAELERLIAAAADPAPYARALAGLDYAEGRVEEAVKALEALIAGAEPSDERRDTQVALAQIRDARGEPAARDALVAAVLAEDAGHVEALKLDARGLIEADKPAEAINALRTALNQAPEDSEVLTLMAAAHEREGARELAGERLALAVEVSGRGAEESARYARFLIEEGTLGPAESVLVAALEREPENRELLRTLGEVHLARRDWARAGQVAALLRRQQDPAADAIGAELEAAALNGEGRHAETIALLERFAGAGGENAAAMAGVVETYLQAGNEAAARTYVDGILANEPENLAARTVQAGLVAFGGDLGAAADAYRAILADAPDYLPAHQALYGVLAAGGRAPEAEAALEAGLAATGGAPELLFAKAGLLEAKADFEGAIAIYEELYALDSAAPVIANNLASLIATHRDDPESLERAFAVARRLKGTEVPAFQDTYGWILARRGDDAEALTYLEPAAKALPDDPLVQFHLGVVQLRLAQPDAARSSLERAVAAAGPGSSLPQIAEAERLLAGIAAGSPAGGN
jgi:predicted Zn-dependent protease